MREQKTVRWHRLVIVGGLIAVGGLAAWLLNVSSRTGQRNIERAELVSSALEVIETAALDQQIDNVADARLAWAMKILAENEQPIVLRARRIILLGADLRCADVQFYAENVRIADASISRTNIDWSAQNFLVENGAVTESRIVGRSGNVLQVKNSLVENTVLSGDTGVVYIAAFDNVQATGLRSEAPNEKLSYKRSGADDGIVVPDAACLRQPDGDLVCSDLTDFPNDSAKLSKSVLRLAERARDTMCGTPRS